MRKLVSAMSAAALAATMAITGVTPLNAAPIVAPGPAGAETRPDVLKVQTRAQIEEMQQMQNWRYGERRYRERRHHWDGGPRYRDVRPRYGWYDGHRGSPHWRRGYRYHDGFWFPAGAFVAGAIIGSAINSGPRYYRDESSAHVRWCYNRYRSYREWDNTFQPYHGPRQQCYSPYS